LRRSGALSVLGVHIRDVLYLSILISVSFEGGIGNLSTCPSP
jgi:hypothetical protein